MDENGVVGDKVVNYYFSSVNQWSFRKTNPTARGDAHNERRGGCWSSLRATVSIPGLYTGKRGGSWASENRVYEDEIVTGGALHSHKI